MKVLNPEIKINPEVSVYMVSNDFVNGQQGPRSERVDAQTHLDLPCLDKDTFQHGIIRKNRLEQTVKTTSDATEYSV